MSSANGRFLWFYAKFAGAALLSAAVVAGIGYFPTVRVAGHEAVWAMIAGCAVSWLASCLGAIPVALAMSARSRQTGQAILASTALRFLVVLLLVVPLALSGWFERTVLVLWVSISYLVLLVVDTAFAIRCMRRLMESDS